MYGECVVLMVEDYNFVWMCSERLDKQMKESEKKQEISKNIITKMQQDLQSQVQKS